VPSTSFQGGRKWLNVNTGRKSFFVILFHICYTVFTGDDNRSIQQSWRKKLSSKYGTGQRGRIRLTKQLQIWRLKGHLFSGRLMVARAQFLLNAFPQKTCSVSAGNTNMLFLFRDIIAVYSQHHLKHTNGLHSAGTLQILWCWHIYFILLVFYLMTSNA
jgi:hypothetical protein